MNKSIKLVKAIVIDNDDTNFGDSKHLSRIKVRPIPRNGLHRSGSITMGPSMEHKRNDRKAYSHISPPSGAHLISAIGDYGGFVHWDLDKPNPDGNFDHPNFGNTTGAAFAQSNPDILVRVGSVAGGQRGRGTNVAYSLDGGKTWQPTPSMPSPRSAMGSIAVNADGTAWIWTPARSSPFLTRNRGDLEDNSRPARKHARHRRSDQSAEVLCNGVVRRQIVYQQGRRRDVRDKTADFARRIAAGRWNRDEQPRRARGQSGRAGPHLRHTGH